jgi:hypothetical protein
MKVKMKAIDLRKCQKVSMALQDPKSGPGKTPLLSGIEFVLSFIRVACVTYYLNGHIFESTRKKGFKLTVPSLVIPDDDDIM